MARPGDPFEEIMIVNPLNDRGEKRMRFYPIRKSGLYGYIANEPGEMGYVAEEPYVMGYMADDAGYVADPPPGFTEGVGYAPMGIAYVAEGPEFVQAPAMGTVYGVPGGVGYFAGEADAMGDGEDAMGYVYEAPEEMGYFAEEPGEMGEDADMGYFAEGSDEMGEGEEAMGYFADEPGEMGEEADMGYFADEPGSVEGYVRETREPAFSPRVVPVDKLGGIEGYIRPKTINPTCESIRPADVVSRPASDWFKPLW